MGITCKAIIPHCHVIERYPVLTAEQHTGRLIGHVRTLNGDPFSCPVGAIVVDINPRGPVGRDGCRSVPVRYQYTLRASESDAATGVVASTASGAGCTPV